MKCPECDAGASLGSIAIGKVKCWSCHTDFDFARWSMKDFTGAQVCAVQRYRPRPTKDDNLAKLELPWKAERPRLVALINEVVKANPLWDFMVNGRRVTRRAEVIMRQRRFNEQVRS